MLTPTGIITPVRVKELIPIECFCMLYAQQVNLFGMRAVLCSYLRLISRCVIFCFIFQYSRFFQKFILYSTFSFYYNIKMLVQNVRMHHMEHLEIPDKNISLHIKVFKARFIFSHFSDCGVHCGDCYGGSLLSIPWPT